MTSHPLQYRIDEIVSIIESGILSERPNYSIAEEITNLEPTHCPYDCDSCHSYDCPCDRLGCAGSEVELH